MTNLAARVWIASSLLVLGFSTIRDAFADADLDPSCWQSARERRFLIRGPENSDYPGARLWNLYRVAYYAHDHSEDSCAGQAFEKAVQDQKKYWSYIGTKYDCQRQKTPSPPCERYALNFSRIELVSTLREGVQQQSLGGQSRESIRKKISKVGHSVECQQVDQARNEPLKKIDHQLIQEGVAVVEKIGNQEDQEDVCQDVPTSQRRKPDEAVFSWENEFYCDHASTKGFAIGIGDIFFLGKQVKGAIESDDLNAESEWDPSVSISAAVQRVTHPKEVDSSWWKAFLAEQKETILPAFDCYTSKIQVAAVCKAFGAGLAKVVEWGGVYSGVKSLLARAVMKVGRKKAIEAAESLPTE